MRSCPRDLVSRADYLMRTLTSVYDNMGKNTPTVYISQVPHTPRPCTRAQLSSALLSTACCSESALADLCQLR